MANAVSLKKRFAFKLVANVVGVLLGLVTMAFVPRALGPEQFGRFEFITNNFKLIFDTMTLQVPVAYFNWVSRKGHKENTDVSSGATLYFSFGAATLFGLVIGGAELGGFHSLLWPEVAPVYLWEALAFTFAVFFYQLLVYLGDGKSLTVGLEKIRLLQNVLKCFALVGLVLAGTLTLHSYFLAQIAVVGGTIVFSAAWLKGRGAWSLKALNPWLYSRVEVERFYSFVVRYTRPLALLMLSGFLFLYFDRWFLQLIGGSAQQGFFGLSDRLGQVAFIFTSAMTPLLTREFAFAHEEQNTERLLALFNRIRIFVFIAMTTSCFLSAHSDTIVALVGGDKFQGAVIPIALMALYPIHQTFGQLNAALMVATGQTSLYAKIGILMMVLSLPLTYFLVAPSTAVVPGLALGATGLALKMLLWQLMTTNAQLFCNTKFVGVKFAPWLKFQVIALTFVYAAAYVSKVFSTLLVKHTALNFSSHLQMTESLFNATATLLFSAVIYLSCICLILYIKPNLAGTSRSEILAMLHKERGLV